MPNQDAATRLETLVEANDLFHWGTDLAAVEAASCALDRLALNPALARALEAKAARLRTLAQLLRDGLAASAPPLLPSFAAVPPEG